MPKPFALCVAVPLLLPGAGAAAFYQNPAPRANTASLGADVTRTAEEIANRDEVLNSERFREVRALFDEWLSVQSFYSPEEIARLKSEFRLKMHSMTARELTAFVDEMEAKLSILLSPEAHEARDWLGYFVSARSVLPAAEVDSWDIVHMSASQIEAALRRVQNRRGSRQRSSQAFNTSRKAQVQSARETQQAEAAARSASRANRSAPRSSNSGRSPYRPPPAPTPRSRPTYFVNPLGGVGIMLN